MDERIDEKLERFSETMERAPTPRERWRLERDAVLDSRPPKTDADPVALREERLERPDIGVEPEAATEWTASRRQNAVPA
ncbi:MAG: hypothetical protein QOK28_2309 [Actinomycetota bacterium]